LSLPQKRKAQNRAAQRAFRERKEKHLKDLENKVADLEKKSETATTENTALRKQLRSVMAELDEYKRKVQLLGNPRPPARDRLSGHGFGSPAINNLNDVHFQFEFPKFGFLPGPPINSKPTNGQNRSSASPQVQTASNLASPNGSHASNKQHSPISVSAATPNLAGSTLQNSPNPQRDALNGLNGARNSLDSGHYSLGSGSTSSPSGSYNSVGGPSSSCGTSPEPFNQSPMGFKPLDTMTTIGEEQPTLQHNNMQVPTNFGDLSADLNFDWLAQQNGGQFDPQLFGDYREPQNNILAGNNFDDSFFNDALDADFFTPFNVPPVALPPKNTASVDAVPQQEPSKAASDPLGLVKGNDLIDCNKVWYVLHCFRPDPLLCPILVANHPWTYREKIQSCEKVQAGDFDLDGLCSELQKKAKCSGKGPTVKEQDFEAVLNKYLGPDFFDRCGKGLPPQKPQVES